MDNARSKKAVFAAILACLLAAGGCACEEAPSTVNASAAVSPSAHSSGMEPASHTESGANTLARSDASAPAVTPPEETDPSGNAYLDRLIAETAAKFATPEMGEYERAKAAFDYMIENTVMDEPVGLNLWRLYSPGDSRLTFVENRSLGVLQYGVGMCEDYAAALTMLLRGLGLEAEYVPGLTYSQEGHLVDHAWTMAKIDGVWYHLDCQLEDNISRHGTVRYRYFMRGDESISASHLWGQRLINSGLLSAEQNAQIAESFLGETCPGDFPKPERRPIAEQPAPDVQALRAQAEAEIAAYEAVNGKLPPMELDVIPPVFGLEGFGPADEG